MRRPVDLDAAAERLRPWLAERAGRWLTTSDHALARAAGLVVSDDGMRLIERLAAAGAIEVEIAGNVRRFRPAGAAPARPPVTRKMAAIAAAATPAPLAPDPRPATVPHPEEATVPHPYAEKVQIKLTVPAADHARLRAAADLAGTFPAKFAMEALLARLDGPGARSPGEEVLAPSIGRALEAAAHEGVDAWTLIGEVFDAGLTLRRACGRGAVPGRPL